MAVVSASFGVIMATFRIGSTAMSVSKLFSKTLAFSVFRMWFDHMRTEFIESTVSAVAVVELLLQARLL